MVDFLRLNENISLIKTPSCSPFSEGFHGDARGRLWAVCTSRAPRAQSGGSDPVQRDSGSCRGWCPELGVAVFDQELHLSILGGPLNTERFLVP